MLYRLGNKSRIANKIIEHFPPHELYIEPFFGAGGMFFAKSLAKYNIVNDIDDEVYNCFIVLQNHKDELKQLMEGIPYHESLLKHWRNNKETDPIKKAARFLFLSNYSYLGTMEQMRYTCGNNAKPMLIKNIDNAYELCKDVLFMNCDFREMFDRVAYRHKEKDKARAFIYADPPYLGTNDNYSNSFTEKNTIDLFSVLVESGIRFAISEFNNPFILDLAKKYNLNIIPICERQTLKNRNIEILITNYEKNTLF